MKKAFAIFLSILILSSSISYSLNAHYCGTQLIDVAFFGDAEECSMAKEKSCEGDDMPCCADRDIIIEGEDYLSSKDLSKKPLKRIDFLAAKLNFPIRLLILEKLPSIEQVNYIPPQIEQEIPILIQSFLL